MRHWAGELVTVFVGVYAAFALNNYQAHRQERQRRDQILAWVQENYSETLTNIIAGKDQLRKNADEFNRRLQTGEMTTLHPFNFQTDYNPEDFTSLLQSGGFDLLEIKTVGDLREVEGSFRRMIELLRHDQQLSDALILPNLDKPPGFFYDASTRQLRPEFAWYNDFYGTQLSPFEEAQAEVGQLLAHIRAERERNR